MTFVRNAWYMADWSTDVTQAPTSITILNEPLVLFRGEDGEGGALADACPHRAVPLSLGTVAGNNVVCPYHGIEFDRGGVCRRNPHVAGPADRLRTRTYPILERYGILWVWPGDPAAAADGFLPNYEWFDQPERYTTGRGYVHIEADYRLIIDNLMDLAHADYIHPNTVGQPGAAEVQQVSVHRSDRTVSVDTIWPDLPPSALHKQAWTRTERVDKYLDMKWHPASNLLLDLGVMAPGEARENGIHTPAAHILTPETDRSTHYFWTVARDFDLANEALTGRIVDVVTRAFVTEDKPIIEAAQRMIDRTGAPLRNFTKGDAGSGLVRRELDRLAELEKPTVKAAA